MIDNGNAVDILYYNAFIKRGLKDSDLKPVTTPLYYFIGNFVIPNGRIILPLILGEYPKTSTLMAEFFVVDCPSTFNALYGKPSLKALKVVTSIYHLAMNFPTPKGVEIVKESQHYVRECFILLSKLRKRIKDLIPKQ